MPLKVDHLYVHVPFCDGKCHYCGFYSEPYSPDSAEAYLCAIETELQRCAARYVLQPETIYIGGGTPTVLSSAQLRTLCRILTQHCAGTDIREWTVEANPGLITTDTTRILADAGVTRISLGAQSFSDAVLARAGRRHTVDDTLAAVDTIRASGIADLNLDLIACLPGTDAASWQQTLAQACDLAPDHLSVYMLTIEEGTPFGQKSDDGAITLPEDRIQLKMLAQVEELLARSGYQHYEISNYAKPGKECVHNQSFWRGGDYLGVGPAAASRLGCKRRTNQADLRAYCRELASGRSPPADVERLPATTDKAERIAFGLRLSEGLDLRDFELQQDELSIYETTFKELADHGLLADRDGRWQLTSRGAALADSVAAEILMLPMV